MLPHLVLPLHRQHVVSVACGNSHILALTGQGHLYGWYVLIPCYVKLNYDN